MVLTWKHLASLLRVKRALEVTCGRSGDVSIVSLLPAPSESSPQNCAFLLFSAACSARLSTVKVSAENLPRVIVLYKTSVAPVLQVCAIVIITFFEIVSTTRPCCVLPLHRTCCKPAHCSHTHHPYLSLGRIVICQLDFFWHHCVFYWVAIKPGSVAVLLFVASGPS